MKKLLIAATCLFPLAAWAQQTPPGAVPPGGIAPGVGPGGVAPGVAPAAPLSPLPPGAGSIYNAAPPSDTGVPAGDGRPLPQTPAPFAPGLPAPGPDSTTSGPLSNRPRAAAPGGGIQGFGPVDELPASLPERAPPMGTEAMRGPPRMAPAMTYEPQQSSTGNTVSGTAAKIGQEELDRLLRSPSGPPLPDADMGAHSGEAREEDELNRRLRVWQLRNKVGEQIISAASNAQKYKKIVEGKGETEGGPQQPGVQPGYPQGQPMALGQQGAQPDPASQRPRTPPLPVVTRVSGMGRNVSATILVPYDGAKTLKAGDRLSNGMRITSIDDMNVVVEMRDGSRKTLPWGDSVPAYEEAAATPRQAGPSQQMPPQMPPTPMAPYMR